MSQELIRRTGWDFVPTHIPADVIPSTLFHTPEEALRLDIAARLPQVKAAPVYIERIQATTNETEMDRLFRWQECVSHARAKRDAVDFGITTAHGRKDYKDSQAEYGREIVKLMQSKGKTAFFKCLSDQTGAGLDVLYAEYDKLEPQTTIPLSEQVIFRQGKVMVTTMAVNTPAL